jgi:DNA-binding transcriptional LysR family regulator
VLRNLDIGSLRSLLTVAQVGGITRAAQRLNLSQSAVSLQIKRLEETFGQQLLERQGRGIALTAHGEQLVALARRLVEFNDETWERMTAAPAAKGEIRLGSPDDIMHPRVPLAMRAHAHAHPGVTVNLQSGQTATLKDRFARGELDVILTTEAETGPDAECLVREPLVWIGAPGGRAWRRRPLPLGTVAGCIFNRAAIDSLDAAGFDWALALDSVSNPAMDASILADMVVRLQMQSTVPAHFETIAHGGALPPLPAFHINMYLTGGPRRRLVEPLAEALRIAYGEARVRAAE